MERRDFIKIAAVTGAATALDGCGNPEHQLIRFIPEEDLTPGVAEWKPSICTMCSAGCGLVVRVMEGDAEVVRNGKLGLIKMGLAKKLEGNPNHPINQGKLCPRGQAGLQVTYHPDRVRNPLKRSGPRGSGQFQPVSWDEAIKELVAQLTALRSANQASPLAFLVRPIRGQRRELIEKFLKAFGAPPAVSFEFFDESVLRAANALSFGHSQLPTLDLAHANYVISFGADFLGTWNSPVAQSIAYGEMRQGRPGRRGKFVMVEPRMSLTGANADEWIPIKPGTEGILALALARAITEVTNVKGQIKAQAKSNLDVVEKQTGVPAATLVRLAHELASNGPAVAIIGGASLANTNSLSSALAVNALNVVLGSVEKPGGISFTPTPAANSRPSTGKQGGSFAGLRTLIQQIQQAALAPKILLLDNANPVFSSPATLGARAAFENIPFIASFGNFIDDTSILADLILPDHSPLESWLDDIPESGTAQTVASLTPPALRPLYNTRAMPDVLLDVAHQLGGETGAALPWKTFEEALHAAYGGLGNPKKTSAKDAGNSWKIMQEQGGWWSAEVQKSKSHAHDVSRNPATIVEPEFDGEEKDFPFHFLPFASQTLYDGSLAHLPWMQETPDPLSTAMWSTWVEINPKAAERLGIKQGDLVEVASQHEKLRAPALLSPGIAPDVVAMPVGQGHEHFGRYASGRGANPIAILAPLVEPETGSLAWAATRVRISRVGEGKLILFAGGMREHPEEHEHR